ncbi:MAG: alpha/beta fold hydrolase [Acidobacteria bacterium]|nr:alpha/beta fold hydrolase [Acidobacteriota bacterium]
MWRPQLAGLAGSCRLLAPDLPGFGGSAGRGGAGGGDGDGGGAAALGGDGDGDGGAPAACRMEDMAAAAAELLDALGLPAAVVCGLSMGGYVALAFYELFPDRVRGLVLADTRAGADDDAGRRRRIESAQALERGDAVSAAAPALAALAGSLIPRLVAPRTLATRPELVDWLRQEIDAAPAAGVAAAQRGMAQRPDRTPLLPHIAVPTLVIVGEEDAITPPAESRLLHQRIRGARLVTIAGAGHLSNLEQPEAFNGALRRFLGSLGGLAPGGSE